jgi:ATP-dependent DNA helicase RecG
MLTGLDVRVRLLTGNTRQAGRREILAGLESGEVELLIGTHALLEEDVRFHRLGLVVIDEQHRFGVAQRAKLWEKNVVAPHILVMTATPIPRTLAMTLYGDLDTSVIDEMPPGRKSVITKHVYEPELGKIYAFIREKIREGRQVYIVYPLIQESETLDLKNLTDGFEQIVSAFPPPQYAVSMVHGQMKQPEKEAHMQRFLENKTQILVATTVVEVGVDVPEASVMVIEHAERFGLAQLHQLRGRVGRGAAQSFCLLLHADGLGETARRRLQLLRETEDGFRIADEDFRARGGGDVLGTRQSGLPGFRLADPVEHEGLLHMAHQDAALLLQKDPGLTGDRGRAVRVLLRLFERAAAMQTLVSG